MKVLFLILAFTWLVNAQDLDSMRAMAWNEPDRLLQLLDSLEKDKKDTSAISHVLRSTAFLALSNYQLSLTQAQAAIQAGADEQADHLAALALAGLDRPQEALMHAHLVVAHSNKEPRSYSLRAERYAALGRHSEAIADLQMAMQLEPLPSPRYLIRCATSYEKMEEMDSALSYAHRTVELAPLHKQYRSELVRLALEAKQYAQAQEAAYQSLKLDSTDSESIAQLFRAVHALQGVTSLDTLAVRWIPRAKAPANILIEWALILREQEQPARALALLDSAKKVGEASAWLHYQIARTMERSANQLSHKEKLKRADAAWTYLQKALPNPEKNANACYYLALLSYQHGKLRVDAKADPQAHWKRALKYFRMAMDLNPYMENAVEYQGLTFGRMNNIDSSNYYYHAYWLKNQDRPLPALNVIEARFMENNLEEARKLLADVEVMDRGPAHQRLYLFFGALERILLKRDAEPYREALRELIAHEKVDLNWNFDALQQWAHKKQPQNDPEVTRQIQEWVDWIAQQN